MHYKVFKTAFFLLLIIISINSTAKSLSACEEAIQIAKQTVLTGESYDKFISIEALSNIRASVDTLPLFEAIDIDAPFITRAAIASIISINNTEQTNKLYSIAYKDDAIADLVIESLQFYKAANSDDFIKWYINKYPDHRRIARALKASALSESQTLGNYIKKNYAKFTKIKLVNLYALYALNKLHINVPNFSQKVIMLSHNNDVFVKEMAAIILGELDEPTAKKRLITLSTDTVPRVSVTALASLARIEHQGGRDKILNILANNTLPDSEIAAGSLKRLTSDDAFKIINKLNFSSLQQGIVMRIVESAGALKQGNAMPLFIWSLKQKNDDLVIQAIFAIGMRANKNEKKLLEQFLHSDDPAIKSTASWAYLKSNC